MLGIVKADGRKIPLGDESVQCVVTSPPYWGLRKYAGEQELVWGGREDCEHNWEQKTDNAEGYTGRKRWQHGATREENPAGWSTAIREHGTCQFCGAWRGSYGLEPTVEMYVQHTVEILREIRRVLLEDGVVFWNIGDSYAASNRGSGGHSPKQDSNRGSWTPGNHRNEISDGLKPKDLCLIPFRVALAAQADGWWVRSDIIWAKPNPMPESVSDRPTDAYEHILMLTKRARYYWDGDAVAEPFNYPNRTYRVDTANHKTSALSGQGNRSTAGLHDGRKSYGDPIRGRNLRNFWTFPTQAYPEAHFATFPEELPKRCILAATKLGDLVLDPFAGSGTVGKVAIELGRRAILCDLAYQDLASKRTAAIQRPLIAPAEAWRE